MSRSFAHRWSLVALVLSSTSIFAQQPKRVFTAADYDRAVKMLGQSLNGLVVGGAAQVTWLPDGRFWYRSVTPADSQVVIVDPVKRTRQPLYNATTMA